MAVLKVLVVCMGNICRSPMGEAMVRQALVEAGYTEPEHFVLDSAGTHYYHTGCLPDERSQATALRHGLDLNNQRARQVSAADFETFDYVLAMDKRNLRDLEALCPEPALMAKCHLILNFSTEPHSDMEVPDPYYGGPEGFEYMHTLLHSACQGFVRHVQQVGALA